MEFNKVALSVDAQLALLKQRGMFFVDEAFAKQSLNHINYYRLRAYWLAFEDEKKSSQNSDHAFVAGTRFESILAIYVFDQQLKSLLSEAIESVEISLRTQWAYQLSLRYGSHAHLKADLFKKQEVHTRCLSMLYGDIGRSKETFITHYFDKYSHPDMPPIWAVCELFTLGQLSHWVDTLKSGQDRQAICAIYGLDERIVCAFLHHLATVRNLCAHHSRVWNRRFTLRMVLPKLPSHLSSHLNHEPQAANKVYNTCAMLAYLLSRIAPQSDWTTRFLDLLATAPQGFESSMGFVKGWQTLDLWTTTKR